MVHPKKCIALAIFLFLACAAPCLRANDDMPKAAWKRPLGAALENPGKKKAKLEAEHIDDGYWQGAPVGGFGAGTFSRSYRGDFVRWHIKGGVHKYETVAGNQFAMFQKAEGDAAGVARVLMNGHPKDGELTGWQWDYPVGAGDYYSLYPKSWFDYRWEKFPGARGAGAVLSDSSEQLQRDQLSGGGVPLARRESDEQTRDGRGDAVLGKHDWMVSHLPARFKRCDE